MLVVDILLWLVRCFATKFSFFIFVFSFEKKSIFSISFNTVLCKKYFLMLLFVRVPCTVKVSRAAQPLIITFTSKMHVVCETCANDAPHISTYVCTILPSSLYIFFALLLFALLRLLLSFVALDVICSRFAHIVFFCFSFGFFTQ